MCGFGLEKIASLWYNESVKAVNLPDKSEFKEMKSCISALMLYVTRFVIFVGTALMEKIVNQFSAKKRNRILTMASAIVIISNADYMSLNRMISE